MVKDFRDVLAELVRAEARFLVVGAHALSVHGVPRSTVDLDVWIDASPDNAKRVWAALAAFGAPLVALNISEADFVRPNMVAQFGLPPYRIDVLTGVSGVSFDEAWKDRVEDVSRSTFHRVSDLTNRGLSGHPAWRLELARGTYTVVYR